MFTLDNNTKVITLGQLRPFLNETCRSLPDSTPITLSVATGDGAVVPCIEILADEESVEFYNF